jgi:small-conductance mechanosensitive channel
MSTVNIIILVVAVVAVIAIIGVRSGPRVTEINREVVRRDENDDA